MAIRTSREIRLRSILETDLPLFFEYQQSAAANYMAAFTAKDPTDRAAFMAHWHKILTDDRIVNRTILLDGQVAGHIGSWELQGQPQVTYWIGREYWGKGLATAALAEFLKLFKTRPLYASAAGDNAASLRVLEKAGFKAYGREKAYANARGHEIEEILLKLE